MEVTEQLTVPLAGQSPAQYLLYAVIVHAGHSLDAGHFFALCRLSGGDGRGDASDGVDGRWWRLDDSTLTVVQTTADTALNRARNSTATPYTLFYRLAGAEATGRRMPVPTVLPGPMRSAVDRDNAVYRMERRGQSASECHWTRGQSSADGR